MISVGGRVLMTSMITRSELTLAERGCEAIRDREAPRVLIGGLGLGFTLRAALDALPKKARVVVAELNPRVVDWCRGPAAPATESAASDRRVQIIVGDLHGINTMHHQPVKLAAMEGLWETQARAPAVLFAIPDEQAERNHAEVAIPVLASIYLAHSPDAVIKGLKEARPEDRPPVAPVFYAFRVMVGIGILMLGMAVWGLWLRRRGRLFHRRRGRRLNGRLRRCHLLLSGGFSLGFDGIGLVHRLLEALDGFSKSLAELRQLAGAENDEHDEQDQNQLCKSHTSKHGVFLQ